MEDGGGTSAAKPIRKRRRPSSGCRKNIWLHVHATQGSSRKRTSSSPYNTSLKYQGKTRGEHVTSETTQMTRQHAPSGFQNHVNAMLKIPNRKPERLSCQCHLFHGRDRVSDIHGLQTPPWRHCSRTALRSVFKGFFCGPLLPTGFHEAPPTGHWRTTRLYENDQTRAVHIHSL